MMRDRLHELKQFQTPQVEQQQQQQHHHQQHHQQHHHDSPATKVSIKRFKSLSATRSKPSSTETLVGDLKMEEVDKTPVTTTAATTATPRISTAFAKRAARTYTTIQSFATLNVAATSTGSSGFGQELAKSDHLKNLSTTTYNYKCSTSRNSNKSKSMQDGIISTPKLEQENEIVVATAVVDPTEELLGHVDRIESQVHSLRIQITRLKTSVAEFETDPMSHGMWNTAGSSNSSTSSSSGGGSSSSSSYSPASDAFAKAIIAEKIDVIRNALSQVKGETLGLSDGLKLRGTDERKQGTDEQLKQLILFHKRRLAKAVCSCSDEFRGVVEGMIKRQNGVLQLSVKTVGGLKDGIESSNNWITSNSTKTLFADSAYSNNLNNKNSASTTTSKLQTLIQANNNLDFELEKEREWKRLESGMTELVDLFGEMRHIVEVQDYQFSKICTSLEDTNTSLEVATKEIDRAVKIRSRSRKTCWWWIGILIVLLVLAAGSIAVYIKLQEK
ncbi:hypothetical protein BDR26DRAFT_871431 [Obelidium mucronatum]|nr:hypothetical protein BDR26DRAFT_871431 [Obelidium mucronatum]